MDVSYVLDYFGDCLKKLNRSKQTYIHWYDLFSFCLDFISLKLDQLWGHAKSKEYLELQIDSNPLILETIIEKSMKHWVLEYKSEIKPLVEANLEILRKLRNLQVISWY